MLRTHGWPRIARRLAPQLRRSFCGRSADEVRRLVSGARAYICDACITECLAVLEKHGGLESTGPTDRPSH
jgi:ATP-dependent Clp protease ATP-binding subunit ClpX